MMKPMEIPVKDDPYPYISLWASNYPVAGFRLGLDAAWNTPSKGRDGRIPWGAGFRST